MPAIRKRSAEISLAEYVADMPQGSRVRREYRALAAAQANARTLREALEGLVDWRNEQGSGIEEFAECDFEMRLARRVLSAPADESALREWGDDLIRAFAKGRCIDVGETETRPYLDAALGAKEGEITK